MTYRLHFIEQLALTLVAVSTLATLILGEIPVTLGVSVGGGLAVANFYALRRLMVGIMQSNRPPRQIALTVLLLLKFGVLGGALYLIMTYVPVNGFAMLFGVSLVVVSIFIEGFRSMLRGAATDQTES